MSSLGQRAAEAYEKQAIGANALRTAKQLMPQLIGTPQLKTLARDLSKKFTTPPTASTRPRTSANPSDPPAELLNSPYLRLLVARIWPAVRANKAERHRWLSRLPFTGWSFKPATDDLGKVLGVPVDAAVSPTYVPHWTDVFRSAEGVQNRYRAQNARAVIDGIEKTLGKPAYAGIMDKIRETVPAEWAQHTFQHLFTEGYDRESLAATLAHFAGPFIRPGRTGTGIADAVIADRDRIALSGRHTPRVLSAIPGPSFDHPSNVQPTVAYKGTPQNKVLPTDGTGMWWSGYPEVATGYTEGTGRVFASPVSKLQQLGPHTPRFTPHIAKDSRGWDEAALPNTQLAGRNQGWGWLPHYESVFTSPKPEQLSHSLFQSIYKSLPSGTGWMQVK